MTKEIDKEQFERLCKIQCTKLEICEVLDIDDKTLDKWCRLTYSKGFSDIFRLKRQAGFASLRRMQYEKAVEGNTTMLIFLGKNWLNQSDKNTILAGDAGQLEEFTKAIKRIKTKQHDKEE